MKRCSMALGHLQDDEKVERGPHLLADEKV